MARECIASSERHFAQTNPSSEYLPPRGDGLLEAQVSYLTNAFEALVDFNPKDYASLRVMATPVLSTEYIPWIKQMVATDDLFEMTSIADVQGLGGNIRRTGRLTRNAHRQAYTRYITLNGDQRKAMDELSFIGLQRR